MPAKVNKFQQERTVERTQGCWNCTHFNNEQLSRDLWERHFRPRDLKVLAEKLGCTVLTLPTAHPALFRMDQLGNAVREGLLGICLKGVSGPLTGADGQDHEAPCDLVQHTYLCGRWTGKDGASVARAGQKADDLPGELMEKFNPK